LNIPQLRTFLSVIEHGSFSAAAKALGVSQPAVTMQIQALEADLGVTLLDRRQRGVRLTEAGEALRPHARKVIAQLEAARTEMESLEDRVTGRLAVAASTTPGQYILPRIMGEFLAAYPEVSLALTIGDTAQVIEAVEAGEAALGMAGAEVKGAKVDYEAVGFDDLVMICPPGHALAAHRTVGVDDIAETPIIMREHGSGTRIVTEDTFRAAGIEPGDLPVVMELGSSEAIVNAVEGGMGIAVVSRLVAEKAIQLGSVSVVPATEFEVRRPLYLVTGRRTPSRAAEELGAMLRTRLRRQDR